MPKGGKTRRGNTGKIVTAGHTTRVEGLDKLLAQLEQWPEITSIRIGQIRNRNKIGRGSKKLVQTSEGFQPKQERKRPKSGGGFNFRATRWAVSNGRVTGIHCNATYGRGIQEVVLTTRDYPALKARLHLEGFGADWEDPQPAEAQA